jgi:hypothetical protein
MKLVPTYDKGEKVLIEYVIDEKFMQEGEIYYTLKNSSNQTLLRGVAFKADELIPVEGAIKNAEEDDGK